MLCFAYGSNMSAQRLAARIPAHFVTTALLPAYRLSFHQRSGDGSGKCDIVPASDQSAVYGVIWEVASHHKPTLDGTTSLFALLGIAIGEAIGRLKGRHSSADFLEFYNAID